MKLRRKDDGVDELQNLLLQVAFAIMMVFIIAYFMFRSDSTREAQEQVIELQRQKLTAALDAVERAYDERYGLAVLSSKGEDGAIVYAAGACIENGELTENPHARNAFCDGAANAGLDYAETLELRRAWSGKVFEAAELSETELTADVREWFGPELDGRIDGVRRRVRDLQLRCAALLQNYWAANPGKIDDPALARRLDEFQKADEETRLLLAADVADALRRHCLEYLSAQAGAPMLR